VIQLACRGYGCEALRTLLKDDMSVPVPSLDATDPDDYAHIEKLAVDFDPQPDRPRTFDPTLLKLRRGIHRTKSSIPDEPIELVWQSFLIDLIGAVFGGNEPFEAEALDQALEQPSQTGWVVLKKGAALHRAARQIVERAPLPVLAAMVTSTHQLLTSLGDQLGRSAEDDLKDASVLLGPLMFALMLTPGPGAQMAEAAGLHPDHLAREIAGGPKPRA
jgi:hypothetical protein